MLSEGLGVLVEADFLDPKIACWMLDPGGKEQNLHRMVGNYTPQESHLLQGQILLAAMLLVLSSFRPLTH